MINYAIIFEDGKLYNTSVDRNQGIATLESELIKGYNGTRHKVDDQVPSDDKWCPKCQPFVGSELDHGATAIASAKATMDQAYGLEQV